MSHEWHAVRVTLTPRRRESPYRANRKKVAVSRRHVGCRQAIHLIVFAFVMLAGTREGFADTGDCISGLKATLSSMLHVDLQATANRVEGRIGHIASKPSPSPPIRTTLVVRRNRDRAFVSTTTVNEVLPGAPAQEEDFVCRAGEILQIQASLDHALVQVKGRDGIAVVLNSERLAGTHAPQQTIEDVLAGTNDLAIIVGILAQTPLDKYLEGATTVSPAQGSELISVEAASRYGHLQLLVDPAYGYLPRRIRLVKSGADMFGTVPVEQIEMTGTADGIWPSGGIVEVHWSADDIVLARNQATPFIKHIVLEQQTVSKAGPTMSIVTDTTVDSVNFASNFPDTVMCSALRVPKGFPVAIEGAPQLPYVWDGSKPVAQVLMRTLASPLAQARTTRTWMVLAAANVLAAVALASYVWRKQRSRR